MKVTWEMRQHRLYIYLAGELDHHAAHKAIGEISNAIDECLPMRCALDLAGLTFMDSSGIAVALGTYRRLKAYGGDLVLENVPAHARKLLVMAGVERVVFGDDADDFSCELC